jgi:hypothetical protein
MERRFGIGIIGAGLVAGCASTPDVTYQYYPATLDALGTIGPAVQHESQLTLLDRAPRPRPAWRIVPRI